ncbi:hypothetical protein Rhopal_006941-T1 [Rhodotorula paludigena]|uniref:Uncharacterized protein n=1 Tax=Rhodotorula paludigena TaxID=86838 RepID=A0AAV5GX17_9BASI|nr:hypothetical protein Rhopal_006941-T1 [Rhodotorula paludigena]
MGVWVVLANLNEFAQINVVTWYNDTQDRAPIWCDISVKRFSASPASSPTSIDAGGRFKTTFSPSAFPES